MPPAVAPAIQAVECPSCRASLGPGAARCLRCGTPSASAAALSAQAAWLRRARRHATAALVVQVVMLPVWLGLAWVAFLWGYCMSCESSGVSWDEAWFSPVSVVAALASVPVLRRTMRIRNAIATGKAGRALALASRRWVFLSFLTAGIVGGVLLGLARSRLDAGRAAAEAPPPFHRPAPVVGSAGCAACGAPFVAGKPFCPSCGTAQPKRPVASAGTTSAAAPVAPAATARESRSKRKRRKASNELRLRREFTNEELLQIFQARLAERYRVKASPPGALCVERSAWVAADAAVEEKDGGPCLVFSGGSFLLMMVVGLFWVLILVGLIASAASGSPVAGVGLVWILLLWLLDSRQARFVRKIRQEAAAWPELEAVPPSVPARA